MSITESSSNYDNLEKMSVSELLENINREDETVPHAVADSIPQIEALVPLIVEKMKLGGRLFYVGAGTSGRLGIVDASEWIGYCGCLGMSPYLWSTSWTGSWNDGRRGSGHTKSCRICRR
jgi:N-acetylmuramic acid 6-phosphate (MurNAc-6-P) etherase